MNKNQIFEIVKNNLPKIKEDFKVKNIWLLEVILKINKGKILTLIF